MSSKTVFDIIQEQILQMDLESMIDLFNDCSTILGDLIKQNPEVRKITNTILQKNSCVLNKDTMVLLNAVFDSYDINTSNFLIQTIQKGGMVQEDDEDEVGTACPRGICDNSQSNPAQGQGQLVVAAPTQGQGQLVAAAPAQGQGQIVSIPMTLGNDTISLLASTALSIQNPGNQAVALDILGRLVDSQIATQQQQRNIIDGNQRFIRVIDYSGLVISFGGPGALMYYFREMINNSAIAAVQVTGNLMAKTSGYTELLFRNVVPYTIQGFISGARFIKRISGVQPPPAFGTLVRAVEGSSVAQMADTSVAQSAIEGVTTGVMTTADSAVIFGCILIYILACISLLLLFYCVHALYSGDEFLLTIPIIGTVGFMRRRKDRGGKKTRKNMKNRKNRKTKRRN